MIPRRILNNPEQLVNDLYITQEYREAPQNIRDQIKLVSFYYGNKVHGQHIKEIGKDQIYRIAERIINDAYKNVKNLRNLSNDKRTILNTILKIIIAKENNHNTEDLEERLAIQAENEDDESFNELINKVLNYKPEKKVISLFPVPI